MKFLRTNSKIKNILRKFVKLLPLKYNGPFGLNFHGITNSYNNLFFNDLHLHVDIFYDFLKILKLNFDIIKISELNLNFKDKTNIKKIFITFDDGYENNLNIAAPIIKSLGLNATIFLSVNNVSSGERIPTFYIKAASKYLKSKKYDFDSISQSLIMENEIENQKKLKKIYSSFSINKIELFLKELKQFLGMDNLEQIYKIHSNDNIMNWDHVNKISQYNFEIASHGLDHFILNEHQKDDQLQKQIYKSYDKIFEKFGYCNYFAYPNGGASDISYKALKLVSESNYKLAFTMWPTSIKYAKSNYLIPRISGNNHIDLKYEIYKSFISHKHYVNWYKNIFNN